MRVAIYTRVSTSDQTCETQRHVLHQFISARGWTLAREYSDTMSGATNSRPNLNQLMADARKKRFDAVLVYKFDRFGRSMQHLVTSLDEFNALGIAFISYSEGIDTTTPSGKMVFGVLASLAEFERSLIRERTSLGMMRAKREGKHCGRPKAQFSRLKAQRLVLDEGLSRRSAAKVLGVSHSTLCRALGTVSEG